MILICPRYNVEEMAEDSAFSMTTAFKDDNNLEICAKVCPALDLQGLALLSNIQYTGPREETKMVVMEIEMVTGKPILND